MRFCLHGGQKEGELNNSLFPLPLTHLASSLWLPLVILAAQTDLTITFLSCLCWSRTVEPAVESRGLLTRLDCTLEFEFHQVPSPSRV